MRITRLDIYRASLPLREPLAHASVSTAMLDEVFLRLVADGDVVGWGEVRGNGEYATGHDAPSVVECLARWGPALVGCDPAQAAERVLAASGNALAAALVDAAALDARARAVGLPVWRLLGRAEGGALPTHAAIGFVSPERACRLAAAALDKGLQRVKARVGSASLDDDIARLAAIRETIGPWRELAADANGAWNLPTALEAVRRLEPLRLAWLEQPTRPGDLAALATLRALDVVAIVADEGVRTARDVAALASARAVHGVQVKLEKSGTVAELQRAVECARAAGLFVEIGQMDQGRLGCAATAHVAAAIGADAYELWGFERVDRDVATGLDLEGGAIPLHDRPGYGVEIDTELMKLEVTLC